MQFSLRYGIKLFPVFPENARKSYLTLQANNSTILHSDLHLRTRNPLETSSENAYVIGKLNSND